MTMATITEDYISFEIAKLLKEKGFDGLCNAYYDCFTTDNFHSSCEPTDFNSIDAKIRDIVSAPTLQMVMKWLRKVHNIVVEPFIREDTKYVWYIHRIEIIFNKKYLVFCWGSKNNKYERYEEACEAAIKYCLEHLIYDS